MYVCLQSIYKYKCCCFFSFCFNDSSAEGNTHFRCTRGGPPCALSQDCRKGSNAARRAVRGACGPAGELEVGRRAVECAFYVSLCSFETKPMKIQPIVKASCLYLLNLNGLNIKWDYKCVSSPVWLVYSILSCLPTSAGSEHQGCCPVQTAPALPVHETSVKLTLPGGKRLFVKIFYIKMTKYIILFKYN